MYCYKWPEQCQRQQTSDIFCGIAWYYGDNDLIIRTYDFTARSDVRSDL